MTVLIPRLLRWEDCETLAPKIRRADLEDLTINRSNPLRALQGAIHMPGEAFGIWDGDQIVGAGGWTTSGTVWTLWQELTFGQAKALAKNCAPWARIMAIRSARPLQNVFLQGNAATRRWLESTRCVDILDDHPLTWEGRTFIPFFLKPLEQLPYV